MHVMVNKHSTLMITNSTWYHWYKEIIQISWGLPLWLHRMPDSKAGRRRVKCCDVTWPRNPLVHRVHIATSRYSQFSLHFLRCFRFLQNNRNHLYRVIFLLAPTDMVECQAWCKFREITTFCSGIIFGFWSVPSFKMVTNTGH